MWFLSFGSVFVTHSVCLLTAAQAIQPLCILNDCTNKIFWKYHKKTKHSRMAPQWNSPHLADGSPEPKVDPDVITVYNMRCWNKTEIKIHFYRYSLKEKSKGFILCQVLSICRTHHARLAREKGIFASCLTYTKLVSPTLVGSVILWWTSEYYSVKQRRNSIIQQLWCHF